MTTPSIGPPHLRITEERFCTWLQNARAGQMLEYHRGFLAFDINRSTSKLDPGEQIELVQIAHIALLHFQLGRAHLVQIRRGEHEFSYIIIAREALRAVSVLPQFVDAVVR